ncbi:MAG: hypothetical protein H6741_13665 [Alphaproteobacteria bacterium]|nr:hypothetical protein [Alphaproteobacteria bacterium]
MRDRASAAPRLEKMMSRLPLVALVLLTAACRRDNDPPKDLADDTGWEEPIVRDSPGMAGAVGAIEWYTLQGSYWEQGSEDFGLAWWGLVEPREFRYNQLYGGQMDGCVANPSFGTLGIYALGVPETLIGTAGGPAFNLDLAQDGFYEATLAPGDFVPNAIYDLGEVADGELPTFAIADLARTPSTPQLQAPALTGSQVPTLGQDELRFEWTPQGADEVYIQIDRQANGQIVESVGCVVADDGSFEVPANLWGAWGSDEWLFIYVGASLEGQGTVTLNNSESRAVGIAWAMAAALTP